MSDDRAGELGHTQGVTPRVVLLSAFLRPFRSGAEACSEEVSARLQGEFDIVIVTARLRRDLPTADTLDGVPVVRVGFGFAGDKWLFPFLAPFAARRLKPALIHAVLESYAGLGLIICSWLLPKVPRLLTCQSTNTSLLVGSMHRAATMITVISSVLKVRAAAFGRPDAVLIPNGITLTAIAAATCPKVPGRILFAGRLEPMKGVDVLLKAFTAIRRDFPAWHLHIVGDGGERVFLETLSHQLSLDGAVTFTGKMTHEAVLAEFAEAEIFAGLSRSEALGNVFLEAQASGCAVLATNVGGIPDIVADGKAGLLIPSDDVAAATEGLRRLVNDPAWRTAMAEAGRHNAQAYDWDSVAARYGEQYKALLR